MNKGKNTQLAGGKSGGETFRRTQSCGKDFAARKKSISRGGIFGGGANAGAPPELGKEGSGLE